MREKIKKPWQAVIITALNLALLVAVTLAQRGADAARIGENGEQVALLQRRLCEEGLYYGECDGSYSIELRSAVKKYQGKNGIEPSGVADYRTMNMLGLNAVHPSGYFDIRVQVLARYIEWKCPSGNGEQKLAAGRQALAYVNGISNLSMNLLCEKNEGLCKRICLTQPGTQSVRAAYRCVFGS